MDLQATRVVSVIGGDGIGPEVVAAAREVLDATGLPLEYAELPVSAGRYRSTGVLVTDEDMAAMRGTDAVLLGAVGHPEVPPGIMERELLLRIRFEFDLGVNLRPVRLLPGARSLVSTAGPDTVDWMFVRENTEGAYSGTGGRFRRGTPDEVALQDSVNTYKGVRRAVDYAFALAETRRKRLTWTHKTNVLLHAGHLWGDVVAEVAAAHPSVEVEYQHADAMCIHLIRRPQDFDVIVADNLFGDLLTDLAGEIGGGVGLMPSANMNPGSAVPGMFEPIHGSAPDIAGQGIANPTGAILSAALLVRSLGFDDAGSAIETAVRDAAAAGQLVGRTVDMTAAVVDRVRVSVGAS
jgi:3-isopropylmalate dehydrogenase